MSYRVNREKKLATMLKTILPSVNSAGSKHCEKISCEQVEFGRITSHQSGSDVDIVLSVCPCIPLYSSAECGMHVCPAARQLTSFYRCCIL